MNRDELKRAAAMEALAHVGPGTMLGVGTGSTTNFFIEALDSIRDRIVGVVSSSSSSASLLRDVGIPVVDLNDVEAPLALYVDGADEATRAGQLIKGGGAALTSEKIVASASLRFICIVDETKLVQRLGAFPLPVEIIPSARRQVQREIERMGGRPILRDGVVTDHGNAILDVRGLDLSAAREVEEELDHIAGVVSNGLFCRRPADLLIVGGTDGVRTLDPRDS